ncbi:MAG: hypothetical protein EZS28_039817 [Streblomastix strix]|uniref:Uncharacterized protein n=1 Tax=Streblomastix strix TaxID=222440 RepID=A0A5J4U4R5_9EUKA|nr:MAG: hypothetical protein EZS28_039817 [Streblomastix strix]
MQGIALITQNGYIESLDPEQITSKAIDKAQIHGNSTDEQLSNGTSIVQSIQSEDAVTRIVNQLELNYLGSLDNLSKSTANSFNSPFDAQPALKLVLNEIIDQYSYFISILQRCYSAKRLQHHAVAKQTFILVAKDKFDKFILPKS